VFATILFINIDLGTFSNERLFGSERILFVSEANLSRNCRHHGNEGLVRGLSE